MSHLINGDMVKEGAIVVDIGINATEGPDGKVVLTGDVDTESVEPVAGAVSPVPGGVGPITDVWVLRNTVHAARINEPRSRMIAARYATRGPGSREGRDRRAARPRAGARRGPGARPRLRREPDRLEVPRRRRSPTASGMDAVIPDQDGAGEIERDRAPASIRPASASASGSTNASGSARKGSAAQ